MILGLWNRPFDSSNHYYCVGDRRTYNKNIAIEWAQGNHNLISLYWLDEVWENMNLTHRPTRSWQQLMKERCIQLRNQANILCLSLSGGYDSQTILDCFVDNNILLDEINVWARPFTHHNPGIQEYQSALHTANLLKNTIYPRLKINKIDMDLDFVFRIYRQYGEHWMSTVNWTCNGFIGDARCSQLSHCDQSNYLQLLEIAKYVVIDGSDKPRLWIENGNWYLTNISGAVEQDMNSPHDHFYISRNLPELHVAQAWMMIDWLESFAFSTEQELHACLHATQSATLGDAHNENWALAIGRNQVRHYSHYSLQLSRKWASRNTMNSIQQQFIDKTYPHIHDSLEYKIWKNGLNNYMNTYPSMFSSNGTSKEIWSKKHFMKLVEPGRLSKKVILEQSL